MRRSSAGPAPHAAEHPRSRKATRRRGSRVLREAGTVWRELDAPYEIARVRELTGLAYRRLGDEEGAQLELEAAAEAIRSAGRRNGCGAVGALVATAAPAVAQGPFTGREVEVLRLIAAGQDEPRYRHGAGDQREDRCAARQQHPDEARSAFTVRCDGVRLHPQPGLIRATEARRTRRCHGFAVPLRVSGPMREPEIPSRKMTVRFRRAAAEIVIP